MEIGIWILVGCMSVSLLYWVFKDFIKPNNNGK
jgi:hypothetical protein